MIDTSSRPLGSTDLTIGRLGLGVAPLGNLYAPLSDAQADETLSAAERLGIRWFDVAPYYGFGLAEARLGRFLQRSRGTPHLISTKVGRVLRPERSGGSPEKRQRRDAGQPERSGGNPEKRQRRDAGHPVATAPAHEQFVAPCPNRPVFDYSRAGIERAYADSLRRLGIERRSSRQSLAGVGLTSRRNCGRKLRHANLIPSEVPP